jgi:putative oxidoreductase
MRSVMPTPNDVPHSLTAYLWSAAQTRLTSVFDLIDRAAPLAMRLSLTLVFIWFGLLKILGESPVADLVSATLPWADPHLIVPVLGGVEVILGVVLLLGRVQRAVLLILSAHLSGTFLTFIMAPRLTMQHGNPLLLTADGEFVLKNLVLISAALLLTSRLTMGAKARRTA